ncbi:MAG: hypothetical protein MJ033_06370 [Victivallaceae bacterium]|nr:hypothetical protein [Victivallaceae bacterium]
MKKGLKKVLISVLALGCCHCVWASRDVDIPINGDFRGAAVGSAAAPGWTMQGAGRIVPGKGARDLACEFAAAHNRQILYSATYNVVGTVLKIDGEIKGSGTATVGFEAFDANFQPVPEASFQKSLAVNGYWSDFKVYFMLDDPRVKNIRLFFMAQPDSRVAFGDLDAEYILSPKPYEIEAAKSMSQAAVSVVAPQVAPQVVPQVAPQVTPQVAPQAVPAPAARNNTFQGIPIVNDRYYSLAAFTAGDYTAMVTPGKDIEFKLAANVARRELWRVESYNPAICRVKLEYDEKGFWPFRYDLAEVEIKGISRGVDNVVFVHSSGARVTVKVEVF